MVSIQDKEILKKTGPEKGERADDDEEERADYIGQMSCLLPGFVILANLISIICFLHI